MNVRRLIASLYLLMFLALGAGSALYFWDAYQEYDRLRDIEARQRRQLAELEAKLEEQQKILERLRHDPVYVEKMIRQRLHYAKPDEFIFRFEQ
ncbi:MAG TPA: septum formation initiator family protein [Opitutus sp.]|nr:septum formation initiator family protein [Opitutus sp.]